MIALPVHPRVAFHARGRRFRRIDPPHSQGRCPGRPQELIRKYEPAILREARLRLGPSLRPLFDSMDLCQSVLGSFFVRIAAGHYELDSPARLMKLLVVMTRNKVREKARRRHEGELGAREPLAAGEDHANRILNQDFLSEFRRRLSDDERVLWIAAIKMPPGRTSPRSWA